MRSNSTYQSTIYIVVDKPMRLITCMKVERAKSGFSPTFCFLDCHIGTAQQKGKQIRNYKHNTTNLRENTAE